MGLGWAARTARVMAALGALALPLVAAAQATLGAKGDTIHGHVADLNADGVVFEPAPGKGSLAVKWEDVESLTTDGPYSVLHGDDGEAHGRILGVEGGKLLVVGESPADAQRIDVTTLFHAYDEGKATGSWVERMRSRMRYWIALFDASAAFTDSTTDTLGGTAGFLIDRRKSPTHFLWEGRARYADENQQHEGRSITENVLWTHIRGELDLTDHVYTYASSRFTHDNESHLALRAEPRAGAGYYFVKSKTRNFSGDVGVAWISEDFFGDEFITGTSGPERGRGRDDFWSIAFGLQGDAVLPFGALWRGRAEYLPAVDDWDHDYLARAETSLDFPMLDWLAFRLAFADEYDNTPAAGSQRNKFSTTGGLVVRFIP